MAPPIDRPPQHDVGRRHAGTLSQPLLRGAGIRDHPAFLGTSFAAPVATKVEGEHRHVVAVPQHVHVLAQRRHILSVAVAIQDVQT